MNQHVEFLVEEPAMKETLEVLAPKLLPPGVSFAIRTFQGKPDLFRKLPGRLKGYQHWPEENRFVVVVDEDREDCHELKRRIVAATVEAGLAPWSLGGRRDGRVTGRIAVEELEAWFLGDFGAICAAFSRVDARHGGKARFRKPDEIGGGTAEALERLLRRSGYYDAPHTEPVVERFYLDRGICESGYRATGTCRRSNTWRWYGDGVVTRSNAALDDADGPVTFM
ncbi:MAG: DUF4276 family protein [Candidatus Riflebacteria bacterium]|nr:DUF4276 family protein [Candidatus Riflebacteria bacterium]